MRIARVIPPVFDGQRIERRENPGTLALGNPSIATTRKCLRPIRGVKPPTKSSVASMSFRYTGNSGSRMDDLSRPHSDVRSAVTRRGLLDCRRSSFVRTALNRRHSKQRFENILETRNAILEIVHDPRGIPPLVLHPSNIQPLIFSSRAMGGR